MNLPETSDDEVRIGIAVTVPPPYGPALVSARARFGDPAAGQIPPHVTLLVPTALAADRIHHVDTHLDVVAAHHQPFVMHLRGTATFRPVSPVVCVQVVEGIASCEQLERDVRTGPLDQELRFPYHPHVTVAHELDDDGLDRAFDGLSQFEASFVVDRFHRYLHGDDGVWRPAREYLLTGAGADAAPVRRP
ncbi:MAG: 2'-5' RNA ligase family protein [Cellulomonas sp.]|nr:2'-5' RNA ligase family protein [Cellulomonas sp.]